jgi:hypothetical protein
MDGPSFWRLATRRCGKSMRSPRRRSSSRG